MKTTTPTTKEIIEIMKQASDALDRFNKAHRHLDVCEKTEADLELWSSNLRFSSCFFNSRIIYK